MKSSICAW